MKEYLKNIPASTLILLGLFFGGALYLIGFWQTFDIDVYQFVPIWEIPKSFIYPFAFLSSLFIITELLKYLIFDKLLLRNRVRRGYSTFDNYGDGRNIFFLKLFYLILLLLIIPLYPFLLHDNLYWLLSGIAISLGFGALLIKLLKIDVKNRLYRHSVIFFISIFPYGCFIMGKQKGLTIYNNVSTNIVNKNIISTITDTSKISSIKLVGFLGDKLIVSSLDNKRIFVLNQSELKGIEVTIPKNGTPF